jgi:radical SAM superfamily enzyme YgiQ (UPF0313 family)
MTTLNPPVYLVSQGKESNVPPLDEPPPIGLLYVGQALEDAGFRVRIFHLHGKKDKSLDRAVASERPLFVGFSNFICPTLKYDIEISRRLTEQGIKVVWGGIFSTCLPEVTLQSGVVDYIVVGEGERAIVPLAEAIKSEAVPSGIPGVGYRRGDEIVIEPPMDLEPDIDKHRFGLELVDWEPYIQTNKSLGTRLVQVPFSRGCPFRCSFCYNAMNPNRRRWRPHSLDYMKDMLGYLNKRYGVNVLFLLCDNPFGKVAEAREIIGGLKTSWMTIAHVSAVNSDFLEWAVKSGCLRLGFGLESGSDRMLGLMNKKNTSEEIKEKVAMCGEAGLHTTSSWMGFMPGETREDLLETFELMDQIHSINRNHGFNLNIFRAYPRTPLWEQCVNEGLVPPRTLPEWGRFRPEFYPFLGYSDSQIRRLKLSVSLLYPFDRSLDRRIGPWLRPLLQSRLKRLKFKFPVEETARRGYRVYSRIKTGPAAR